MDVSLQLYSAREFTPWEEVIPRLAEFGYTQVEGFGGVYGDPAAFRALLDAQGLAMPSGHFFPIDMFEEDPCKVLDTARALGMERVICPALAPDQRSQDAEGWRAVAARLEAIAARMQGEGLRFAWHNHDFEFALLGDGSLPMEILLQEAPSMEWQADLAWIERGGADPMAWIGWYGSRISSAHVKDIAPDGENADEDGWADVGHGTLDWRALTAALREAGTDLFVIEHDKPSDVLRFAQRSIETFRAL